MQFVATEVHGDAFYVEVFAVGEMVGLVLEQFLGWGGVGVSWVASRECTPHQVEGVLW